MPELKRGFLVGSADQDGFPEKIALGIRAGVKLEFQFFELPVGDLCIDKGDLTFQEVQLKRALQLNFILGVQETVIVPEVIILKAVIIGLEIVEIIVVQFEFEFPDVNQEFSDFQVCIDGLEQLTRKIPYLKL